MASTKNNLSVLFEDNHFIIINKQSGDIVQGDKTGDTPLSDIVKEYIKEKYNKPGNVFLGVVHRLDRPTTGIIVFAKTSKSLERFNKMLRDKTVNKTYWAVVKNKPAKNSDTLTGYLKKNPKNNKSTSYSSEIEGSKKSILHYKLLKSLDNYHLLEVDLETGRHHQIRCQLAAIGSPIKGDLKYGFDRSNKDASIHLHARKIVFTHPVAKETISITAPTPNEVIWNACN
ncbi:RluA family pseudouridine synthase [uncultured Lutibacter sp.]|uniref:RluA family pseudouridine synthase n=1 Tax=uncultured Lutibacter sp. TaxID=437739 RepID=UPI00261CB5F1|nr:RNA pseudouridine synthase [uncultured Lutibacter sp.]